MMENCFCPYCGTDIIAGQRFCHKCGKQIPVVQNIMPQQINVRQMYNEDMMHEIISKPSFYSPPVVEACRRELEIRKEAAALMPEVQGYPDHMIYAVLASPCTYSDAVVYCCQKVQAERLAEQRRAEEQRKAQEQQRLLQEELEKHKRRAAWWKKNRKYFFLAFVALVALLVTMYLHSDGRQYGKGVDEYEKGNYAEAIEWLEKVGDGYKNAANANWLLYKSYLNEGDSAKAAAALAKATKNKQWDEHPEAYQEYIRHLVNGTFAPYITVDETLAASLLETAGDRRCTEVAGELYFKNRQWGKAYSLISTNVSTSRPDALEERANAYMGALYLFGLGGVETDLQKAVMYFNKASYKKGIAEYMMMAYLANMSKKGNGGTSEIEKIAEIADAIGEDNLSYMGKVFAHAAHNFYKAEQRHKKESYGWSSYDDGWNSYYYNNMKGFYQGEYAGNYYTSGGAHGWGYFTNQLDTHHFASLGKYVHTSKNCPMNGEGVRINYYDDGSIVASYGVWENDELKEGSNWSNSSVDSYLTSSLSIQLPF